MEESAEQVASTHGAPVILGADGRPGQRIWWSQPECPVGTVAVVMLDIDPEDLLQVAAAEIPHRHRCPALGHGVASPVPGDRLGRGGAAVDAEDEIHGVSREEGVEAGHVATIGEAFDRFLGHGAPAYVDRETLGPAEAIAMHGASPIASR